MKIIKGSQEELIKDFVAALFRVRKKGVILSDWLF
jgi:hypothetical protein